MNLYARIIGVGCYALSLLIIMGIIQHQSRKEAKLTLSVYLIALVLMGYFYKPNISADLYRYVKNMHYYSLFSFADIQPIAIKTTHPGAVLYLYIIGQLGNDSLLPAISAFIDLILVFSVIKCEAARNKFTGVEICDALFFLMSTGILMGMISGIRNTMAYCIILWCLYR